MISSWWRKTEMSHWFKYWACGQPPCNNWVRGGERLHWRLYMYRWQPSIYSGSCIGCWHVKAVTSQHPSPPSDHQSWAQSRSRSASYILSELPCQPRWIWVTWVAYGCLLWMHHAWDVSAVPHISGIVQWRRRMAATHYARSKPWQATTNDGTATVVLHNWPSDAEAGGSGASAAWSGLVKRCRRFLPRQFVDSNNNMIYDILLSCVIPYMISISFDILKLWNHLCGVQTSKFI